MTEAETKIEKCLQQIRIKTDFKPLVGLILGSGLGDYASKLRIECEISYSEIDGFPVSTVPGHAGKYIFGYLEDVPVVCMKGRVHFYEGYSMSDVVLPVRLMHCMGAGILFLTNAAGGLNKTFSAGDLMLIKDHIAAFVPNPLIGPNSESLGTRFPDMSHIYDQELAELIKKSALELDITLREGVYAQMTGPSYESPAEVKMLGILGADAVGMSTAVEAIAANHAGMRICGISCISNMAAGISKVPLNHKEVQEAADKAAASFSALVSASILKMGRLH